MSQSDPAIAEEAINQGVRDGSMGMATGSLMLKTLPKDQAAFRSWQIRMSAGLSEPGKMAELLMPLIQTNNTGGFTTTQSVDKITGQPTITGQVKNTQDPNSVASVAATIRGQNMVDQRSRETNTIQRDAARTQVVETPEGVMLIDKGTGQARPAMMGGKPVPGKQPEAVKKELMSIGQQRAIIQGALADVEQTPSAFSMGRGLATMSGAIGESVAGRFDTDKERQARSYLFNNVSKVINERAGAAQSAQELARLRGFMPAETDAAPQIVSKLKAFETYLNDLEAGTLGKPIPSASGPRKVNSVDEAMKLPPGTVFIDPNGIQRVR
jgi:hypothetical protein